MEPRLRRPGGTGTGTPFTAFTPAGADGATYDSDGPWSTLASAGDGDGAADQTPRDERATDDAADGSRPTGDDPADGSRPAEFHHGAVRGRERATPPAR